MCVQSVNSASKEIRACISSFCDIFMFLEATSRDAGKPSLLLLSIKTNAFHLSAKCGWESDPFNPRIIIRIIVYSEEGCVKGGEKKSHWRYKNQWGEKSEKKNELLAKN